MSEAWEERLNELLPLYGHRNWIVVADAAYPAQSNPGIETLATGADQLDVVKTVLERIGACSHVRAHVANSALCPKPMRPAWIAIGES